MSARKVLLAILVASCLLLAADAGSRGAGVAWALPPVQEPDPSDKSSGPSILPKGERPARPEGLATTSGGPIGDDFVISNAAEVEVQPAVAYNPLRQEYLVVWYNDRPGNDDIRAQRVSRNGALAGGPFYISAGPGAERRYPDVAYNSQRGEYLVVWEHYESSSGSSIHARRVSGAGMVIDTADIVVRSSGFNLYTPANPAVAYASTSDRYLVVWEEDFHPNVTASIVGQVLSSAGAPDGSTITISQDPVGKPRREPDLAYNRRRNEYLVVWQQLEGDYDIYARRVTGNGQLLQPTSIEIGRYTANEIAPAVAAIPTAGSDGQYLVVWELRYTPTDGDIYARPVAGGGTTGSGFTVSDPVVNQTNPAVAGQESNQQYLVVWTHPAPYPFANIGIAGRVVSSGGALLGQETTPGGWVADRAAVAGGPLGDFLVAYDDDAQIGSRGIYGQLWGNRLYLPLVRRNAP